MKYSLRSLMIMVLVAPAGIAYAVWFAKWFLNGWNYNLMTPWLP